MAQSDPAAAQSAIDEAMRRGDYLVAFDLAQLAADAFAGDRRIEYAATLALARSNATEQAARRYDAALRGAAGDVNDELRIDILSLAARIEKDRAFRAPAGRSREALRGAAGAYAAVFEATRAGYPAVNAATLSLLAGDVGRAHALARGALIAAECDVHDAGVARYYRLATVAEAHLVLGQVAEAAAALAEAIAAAPRDFGAHATTLRQLRRLAHRLALATDFLAPLRAPGSLHYAGHRFSTDVGADEERRIAADIARLLDARSIGFVFGSLAAGADILFAEAALARGCTLHVVLPFALADMLRISVAPSGTHWVERFSSCLERAERVTYATTGTFLGDDVPYEYASRFAMGLTILQASRLSGDVHQAVVWDGVPSDDGAIAGTWADMQRWRTTGHATEVVEIAPRQRAPERLERRAPEIRTTRALLFGDIKHFSRLPDEMQLRFTTEILSAFAEVLDRYEGIELRNTWGDGLFIVVRDAATAAACALELQDAIGAIDLAGAGFPDDMGLRLCGHFGPVFTCTDPITQRPNFIGEHVCRAARFEPVTPEGSVFVTEAFAAELSLCADFDFRCEYVGRIEAAKGYGTFRMHSLMRNR